MVWVGDKILRGNGCFNLHHRMPPVAKSRSPVSHAESTEARKTAIRAMSRRS